jgi:hypothetical protein
MAQDALNAYQADVVAGKDALLVCDTKEMADALNRRIHDDTSRGADRGRGAGAAGCGGGPDHLPPQRRLASRCTTPPTSRRWRISQLKAVLGC